MVRPNLISTFKYDNIVKKFLFCSWSDVRLAALEALVDFTKVDGRWPDLEFLLDLAENDPEPSVRHQLIRMLVENPPFERSHKHRLDKEELVERLWNLSKWVTMEQIFKFITGVTSEH
jgi:hypothetical protein